LHWESDREFDGSLHGYTRSADMALDGACDRRLGTLLDVATIPESRIKSIEVERVETSADALDLLCREWNIIWIGPHEGHVPAIPRHQNGVTGQKGAAIGEKEHRAAWEMAAQPAKRHTWHDLEDLSAPEFDGGIGVHDPFPIGFMHQHGAVEHTAPLGHCTVEMRMRNCDRPDPAEGLNDLDGCPIEKAEAVPKNIALGHDDQKRSLPDGELRGRRDSKQTRRYFSEGVEMSRRELLCRDPLLARFGNELPLILADQAAFGRCDTVRVLNAAGFAQELRHAGHPPWATMAAPGERAAIDASPTKSQ